MITRLNHSTWFLGSESVADFNVKTKNSTPCGSPGTGLPTPGLAPKKNGISAGDITQRHAKTSIPSLTFKRLTFKCFGDFRLAIGCMIPLHIRRILLGHFPFAVKIVQYLFAHLP